MTTEERTGLRRKFAGEILAGMTEPADASGDKTKYWSGAAEAAVVAATALVDELAKVEKAEAS